MRNARNILRQLLRTVVLLIATVTTTGCYDRMEVPVIEPSTLPAGNLTLRDLAARCSEIPLPITEEIVVCGVVTSSDAAGNFYHSIMLQQEGCGIEILAGLNDLYRIYPPGCSLAVRLRGLAISRRYGVVQIGTMPSGGEPYAVAEITSRALLDQHLVRGAVEALPEPIRCRIEELHPTLCGTLVQIESLTVQTEEEVATWSGYRRFVDCTGQTIAVYTSRYARFADTSIPTAPLTLTGILQYGRAGTGDDIYILKLRDEEDFTL